MLSGPPPVDLTELPPSVFRMISVMSPLDRRSKRQQASVPSQARAAEPNHPSWLRRRLREIAFLPDPQIYWLPGAFAAARRAMGRHGADVIFCSGPPFSGFILGRALKLAWGVPLVLDYRDVWLDHPWWPVPRWRRPIECWTERRLLSAADLILANHDAMLGTLIDRLPQVADRCLVVPNGFDPDELGPPVTPRWNPGQVFEIVYAGTLYAPVPSRDQAQEPLSVQRPLGFFRAIHRLMEQGVFGSGGVRVTFVGARPATDEASHITSAASECGIADMVSVLPRMEKALVVPLLRRAHLLLNILYYTEAQVAQKAYDYLHLGIPILSLLRESEANAIIVRRARAGPIIDPSDSDHIVDAIDRIVSSYVKGESPIESDRRYIDQFDARKQAQTIDSRLRPLLDRRRAKAASDHAT